MSDKKILEKIIEWLTANTKEQSLSEELRQDSNRLLLKINEWCKENE